MKKLFAKFVWKVTNLAHKVLKNFVKEEILIKWKPIHLCWWFEKNGWEIPTYFIGTTRSIAKTDSTTPNGNTLQIYLNPLQIRATDSTTPTDSPKTSIPKLYISVLDGATIGDEENIIGGMTIVVTDSSTPSDADTTTNSVILTNCISIDPTNNPVQRGVVIT
jgi:hypothetical protein